MTSVRFSSGYSDDKALDNLFASDSDEFSCDRSDDNDAESNATEVEKEISDEFDQIDTARNEIGARCDN